MSQNLSLLIGGVGLVKGSVRGLGPALSELSHELGAETDGRRLLAHAPFKCISLIVRWGAEALEDAEIGRVNGRGELEVAVQVAIDELRFARGDVPALKSILEPHVRKSLVAVAEEYGLA